MIGAVLRTVGCLGSDPEAVPTTAPAADEPIEPDAAPAPPATGALEASEGPPQEAETDEAAPAPEPVIVTTPIEWPGNIPSGVCVPDGPRACVGVSITQGSTAVALERTGVPQRIDAMMTWENTSPLSAELSFGIDAAKPCGEGCIEFRSLVEEMGAAPLERSLVGITLDPEETEIGLHAGMPPIAQDPVYAYARIDQPFTVTGAFARVVASG